MWLVGWNDVAAISYPRARALAPWFHHTESTTCSLPLSATICRSACGPSPQNPLFWPLGARDSFQSETSLYRSNVELPHWGDRLLSGRAAPVRNLEGATSAPHIAQPAMRYTSVTSIPALFRVRKSDCGICGSVMIWWTTEVGAMRDRLLRPNLLESHTATTRLAISIITRLTLASRMLGVLSPYCTSNPSTPKNRMSAFRRRSVSSAIGPTRENEFLRNIPPVRITSGEAPASSVATLTALVMMVTFVRSRNLRATHVVVVPESRTTTCPSLTRPAAAVPMRSFSLR